MANIKATMTDIRGIIRAPSRDTSVREMERRLKLSRTSLRNYRGWADASGKSMAELLGPSDAELRAIMQKAMHIKGAARSDIPSCRRIWKNMLGR